MARRLYTEKDKKRASGAPSADPIKEPGRSCFQKDYARLLHAPAFRRLQGKTQLFPGSEDDFFRNRLTHSLEVAQIAVGIASKVNVELERRGAEPIDEDLVRFAALAHDLGHPPFGHNGEKALDELMIRAGGFEGNAQTLHILASVESKQIRTASGVLSEEFGLDLTFRTLASVLKYDRPIPTTRKGHAPLVKGYYREEKKLVQQIKSSVAPRHRAKFKTLECSIMDVADDIAYSTYDLEDSLHACFVTPAGMLHSLFRDKAIRESVRLRTNAALRAAGHKSLSEQEVFLQAIRVTRPPKAPDESELVSLPKGMRAAYSAVTVCAENERLVESRVARTAFTAERVGKLIDGIELHYNKSQPSLSFVRLSRDKMIDVELQKHLNYQLVIRSPRLAISEHRGKEIVQKIFGALAESKGALLKGDWRLKYTKAKTKAQRLRVVCDYVAGMTDRYAVELYEALFGDGKTIYKPH